MKKFFTIVFTDVEIPLQPFDLCGKPCPGFVVFCDAESAINAIDALVRQGFFGKDELKVVPFDETIQCCEIKQ